MFRVGHIAATEHYTVAGSGIVMCQPLRVNHGGSDDGGTPPFCFMFSLSCLDGSSPPRTAPPVRIASIYVMILFFYRTGIWSGGFFRLGLSMGFSKLEFLVEIASSERRLLGAAPTPLALPYPFRTPP